MPECGHMVTEKGICITCGQPFENPYWTLEELQEAMEKHHSGVFLEEFKLNLGDIPAIGKLAEDTWNEYDRRATENEEPLRPEQPRLSMIGGQMIRIPFHQIFHDVVSPSYEKAVNLGYRGDYTRWCEFVKENQPRS